MIIYLVIFIFEVGLLSYLEKKIWRTFLTPLNILAFPYLFATLIAIFYSYLCKDIPNFYMPSLIIWILGLMTFFIPSIFFSRLKKTKNSNYEVGCIGNDDAFPLLRTIAFICIAISFLRIRTVLSGDLSFGTDEFSEQYEVSGILAHLSVLMSAIFAYMIYKADYNHKSAYWVTALSLIGMFAIGVKSWIIAPFLIGYLARLLSGKTVFSFKSTLLPVIICVFIFFVSYYIIMVISGETEMTDAWIQFIINHFINYLAGGTLSLSLDYKMGILEPEMCNSLFAPIYNIYNALVGNEYIGFINPIALSIGELGDTTVRTFMGTIWVYGQNPFVFLLVVFVFSFCIYFIYYYSKRTKNIFLLLANCNNLTFLALGFFDFYWLTLSPYEVFVIFILMSYFCRIVITGKCKSKIIAC